MYYYICGLFKFLWNENIKFFSILFCFVLVKFFYVNFEYIVLVILCVFKFYGYYFLLL